MKNTGKFLVFLSAVIGASCKQQNPADFKGKLVGEWQIVGAKSKEPNLLIYLIDDGGLFAHDDLTGKWRGYSAWLSDDRNTLLGRQGCTEHYALRISYLPTQDRIVINDTFLLRHISLVPRQPKE
ncbi:hypothetical protein [Hymenobacter psoromatis]|uniref:hypothetical protein n=1 Tax=Hymenobacter psoromatis TaxID=1484116 RepID=UPI001CBB71BA|nr:hypothetical protein [Hymenobacter psoromatis]